MRSRSAVTASLIVLFIACAPVTKVPITNRKQRLSFTESEMIALANTNYAEFLQKNPPLPATDPQVVLVRKIGVKIQKAVEDFMKEKGLSDRITGYAWEFNVVNSNDVNAWCMPGGKVVVYTGLLPVTADENGLAVVMGHEIAHAIARHGNERMSQQYRSQNVGNTIGILVGENKSLGGELFKNTYNIGAGLTLLKYSRTHETEADKLGVVFMAMAGYDPEESIKFWERMAANGSGGGNMQVLSTHPSDETRINALKKFMPTAKGYYKK